MEVGKMEGDVKELDSLEHPGWECVRLSNQPKLEGISVSSPTIQSILIKNQMGSKYERLLKLEQQRLSKP